MEADRSLEAWLAALATQVPLDEPLLDDDALARLADANLRGPHRFDLAEPLDAAAMQARVVERLGEWKAEASGGALFDGEGRALASDALGEPMQVDADGSVYLAAEAFGMRCTPRREAFYRSASDRRFDRNRCSHVERGEPIQPLAHRDGQWLVRSGYSFGYVDALPLGERVHDVARAQHEARRTSRHFTRREVLTRAFAELGRPYGWGGEAGGLDCSAFVLAVLQSFGLPMPRHSADQVEATSFHLDVPPALDDAERQRWLDAANERGLVLVHFPGHVMLYLGRDARGVPMAIHAFAEYVEPCASPEGERRETLRLTRGVDVSSLELGRGTSRRSYLERMSAISVIGGSPGPRLAAHAIPRAASAPIGGACTVEDEPTIFRSPRRPHAGGALRLLWVGDRDPGPTAIVLTSAEGRRVELPIERIEGGPYGLVARWEHAQAGTWTAWLGDGERRLACENLIVEPARTPYVRPVTSAHNAWTPSLENLWSIFVEKLFDHPIDDRTWPDLQTLLRDPERNLLFDHFTADEESRLSLSPDCADLPFMLRAYFAWKMGAPFAVRSCSRGREGSPPACGQPTSNVGWLQAEDRAVADFQAFATQVVGNTVHSASARTPPRTDASDLYPIPLTREALRPGTVYADPYGHVMMLVRFVPPAPGGSGMLVAADAQPDGTIGRPRFWRGTFLFTPETRDVGAGFKAFRPVERRGRDAVRQAHNASLVHARVPYSTMQYEGSLDDFYDRVEALIDPQPLDAETRLLALVDALQDSVERRTVSVDNAERWLAEHPGVVIPMPVGADIFQTEGPWEDFSTPSRDLRLLLALDTVLGFPDAVRRRPERFGVREADVEASVSRLRERLARELAARTFVYRGTSGAETRLTLADVQARIHALEAAYDPNDCPERRWGAPAGSEELLRCTRRAPREQQQRLETYRAWFARRERPVR